MLLGRRHKDGKAIPLVIAGPCSAESEHQVLETCTRLAKTQKVDMLRAGIWKPRTRPGTFEGVGAIGLPWMKKAKEATGLPVTVEVAKASHVELCLEFEIDALWIGARTTVNPFAVQEIADALKGVDIPVMVKNPINPDLALWLGGIERLEAVGIKEIGAIHRGFSNMGEKIYRNRPQWQIPIEFKSRRPDIPMICDPSHICGRRDILHRVSQKAVNLNFDGLMIESHITPDEAWSDAKQQITPAQFDELMKGIVYRSSSTEDQSFKENIDHLRGQIDEIDNELLNLLGERMQLAESIGQYKKKNNIAILQSKRWNEILDKSIAKGEMRGLSKEFIGVILKAIHQESINHQAKVMNEKEIEALMKEE